MQKSLSINTRLNKLLEDELDMALKRRAKRAVEELDPQSGDTILDLGCGPGHYLKLLSFLSLKLHLIGVDMDKDALFQVKKNLERKGVSTIDADLMKKLPFQNNSFGKILMSEVIEHLPDDSKALKEVYRIIKKRGVLIITVPNANFPFFWDPVNWILNHYFKTCIKKGFWGGIWTNHERLYNPEEIKKLIEKVGFKVTKLESLTWWCLPFNHNLLYGGKFSKATAKSMSNYIREKSLFSKLIFGLININDKINDLISFQNIGVGILIRAIKE